MKVFFSNYHISVNPTLVDDLLAAGLEVVVPRDDFQGIHIGFFAPNTEHFNKPGVIPVTYAEYLTMEPMAMIIPCEQMIKDFKLLRESRGNVDVIVYLTANSNAADTYPDDSDFIISHDLYYHRATKAKYKIWYFNQPTFEIEPKTEEEIREAFDNKHVNLYVNNFYDSGFEPELQAANQFRELYQNAFGVRVNFFGYGNEDGWPQPPVTHQHMKDSMFTLCFKRRETWGQMVNESMQIGTPCIFMEDLMWSTFKDYLINQDISIIGCNAFGLVDAIINMTFDDYLVMVKEAQWQSRMYCNTEINVEKLKWLFNKVEEVL